MATMVEKIRNDIAKLKKRSRSKETLFVRWRLSLRRKKIWKSSMVKAVKMDNKERQGTAFLKAYASGMISLPEGMPRRETPRMRKRRDMRMKHNFMTKMVSALLAVVLSTAAFSVTALPAAARKARSLWLNRKRLGMSLICFPLWQAYSGHVSVTEDGIQFSSGEMTLSRPAPSPRAAAI